MVLLRYKSGAMAEVTVTTAAVHVPTNRLELHGTKGTILEDHDWEKPVKVFSSIESPEKKGAFYSPELEHGPFPLYYTISFRNEDTHFAECIVNDTSPEFTPEEAQEAVAVVHLAYLAAKKGAVTTMDELKEMIRTSGTKGIFDGLEKVPLKNYENLKW
jgi:predicted dehydrogenase